MQNYNIPVTRVDGADTAACVTLECLPARGVTAGAGGQAGSRGETSHHGREIIEVGVAVSKEKNILVRIIMPYRTLLWITVKNLC